MTSAPTAASADLFSEDLLGQDAHEAIVPDGRDQCQTHARVAGRGLHQCHPWPQHSAAFSVINNGQCDPVLDTTAGVQVLALGKDRNR